MLLPLDSVIGWQRLGQRERHSSVRRSIFLSTAPRRFINSFTRSSVVAWLFMSLLLGLSVGIRAAANLAPSHPTTDNGHDRHDQFPEHRRGWPRHQNIRPLRTL